MAEITPVVNTYCQKFKQKEQLRRELTEVTKEVKDAHDKLLEQMSIADLRIIRSISAGFDIKLYQKIKKPGSSIKKLRQSMQKNDISDDTISLIMNDIQIGKEETSQVIKLIPLNKTKNSDSSVV
jgi:hypothetical protein